METNQQSAMTTKPCLQIGGPAAVPEKKAAAVDRGVMATGEQARAIICTAKRAVEEAKQTETRVAGGAASAAGKPSSSSSSLKRSLECFLEGRKNKLAKSSAATRRRHLKTSTTASSSSSSCVN